MAKTKVSRGLPRRTGKAQKKASMAASHARLPAKKDRRVKRSSHGKFITVAALEAHRKSVS